MWFHIILKFGSKQVRVNEKGLMPEMLAWWSFYRGNLTLSYQLVAYHIFMSNFPDNAVPLFLKKLSLSKVGITLLA